ncbi:MAG: DedA family protein [Verrucomicrobiae bacterium]|nr:DedA family protein [Verrucomicrobiae bacterium]
METFFQWVTDYGYLAIFLMLVLGIIGLPIPDETMLTFAGYLVYRGDLNLVSTLVVAFLGTTCGITTSFILGRTIGLRAIKRYGRYVHVTEERLLRVHNWFERVGKWTLTFGYFVPGVRHLTALVAGSSKLEWPVFCLFAYSGGLVWSSLFILLGYLLGEGWEQISEEIHTILLWIGILAVCIFAFLAVWYREHIFKLGRGGDSKPAGKDGTV